MPAQRLLASTEDACLVDYTDFGKSGVCGNALPLVGRLHAGPSRALKLVLLAGQVELTPTLAVAEDSQVNPAPVKHSTTE